MSGRKTDRHGSERRKRSRDGDSPKSRHTTHRHDRGRSSDDRKRGSDRQENGSVSQKDNTDRLRDSSSHRRDSSSRRRESSSPRCDGLDRRRDVSGRRRDSYDRQKDSYDRRKEASSYRRENYDSRRDSSDRRRDNSPSHKRARLDRSPNARRSVSPPSSASARPFSEARERAFLTDYLRSSECPLKPGSEEATGFWPFHALYVRRLAAAGVERGRSPPPPKPSRKVTEPFPLPAYDLRLANPLFVERRVRDRRDARELERQERERREPEARRGREVLAAYLHFLQKQKFAKLKKLREAQRNLPIYQHREEILAAVRDNPVVIVAGDTGCGKSTQLPQYLLQAGYNSIACTQPRRIACIALCQRVSHETLQQYGDQIGYQIRFEKRRTARTRVVFLTEGLLLRQVSADPLLSQYDVIVLDEVHERHLQGDFLLGVMKCLVRQRPELRLVLMSATINIQLFRDYFHGKAPVIQIPGRLFPIQLNYRPISVVEAVASSGRLNPAPFVRVLSLIDDRYPAEERGDLLMFLSGVAEITAVADACEEYARQAGRWIVLPLHSQLSVQDQDKVFAVAPDGVRKCIVSTNIAETSVTIDGVRFVVDSGKVKEMSYDSVTRMQRLKEFWVSQASAEQRKGRAGRTGPGVCYRLYSEDEFDMLAPYATPEIQRVPLESLVLQMVALGLPDARRFPFLDRPAEDSLEDAIRSLVQQGALTSDEQLTPLGQMLSQLPVDVTVGKMLVLGSVLHQMGPVLSAAAALSVQTPLTNRAFREPDCLANLKPLFSSHGDSITLLEAFVSWLQIKVTGKVRSRAWCGERGLEEQRFYELVKLRRQFMTIMEESRLLPKPARLVSAADRVRRHGELSQLRAARRELQESQPRRRRLARGPHGAGDSTEQQRDGDVADIEFQMRTGARDLQELLQASKLKSYQDQTLLKIILCSGLYPNFALPDLHNNYKPGSDQVFHSASKPFVVLHPNSVLSFSPETLEIADSDVRVTAGPRPPRHSVTSDKHQLLAFVTLLETSKPYVTGVTRVPALQVALLFSGTIDTDLSCRSLVCDRWVEFLVSEPAAAQQLLARAVTLRRWWSRLLQTRLDNLGSEEQHEPEEESTLRGRLVAALIDFFHTDVFYSHKRLVPADLDGLYCREPEAETDGRLPPFIRYDCLISDSAPSMEEETCPYCDNSMSSLPVERIVHWSLCIFEHKKTKGESAATDAEGVATEPQGPACEECGASLEGMTGIQILRHRRTHRPIQPAGEG
ncbi:probable ATP-dependent RNA helicase DHX34 [Amphibalanus amphitrite]|uniref:probable ATP-dependent RNA helicase DHX34 n=1 Tax=Amphibalanus amphitrite TaxID=1232801 RepID=UPI001C907D80|nr:probable ATP-dependent RNA helicase DHX34 [Amphibalanus amphitrite]